MWLEIRALLLGQLTWNIPLLIGALLIILMYFILLFKYKPVKLSIVHPILFSLGMLLLYMMTGSPLLAISYLSFSFHMIQMSVLFFIIPPLILLGIPSFLYKRLVNNFAIQKVRPYCISPKVSLYFFASLFFIYHIPFMLAAISNFPLLQKGYLVVLFGLSFRMLWPITSPNPSDRLNATKRKKYILLSGLIITPACLLFIVTGLLDGMNNPFLLEMTAHLCLPSDAQSFQLLPPPFNTKYDQMMSGIFMMCVHKVGLSVTSNVSTLK